MSAILNDSRTRRARAVAFWGRLGFGLALLLSVAAGAGWEHPTCCDHHPVEQHAITALSDAGR